MKQELNGKSLHEQVLENGFAGGWFYDKNKRAFCFKQPYILSVIK